MLCVAIKTGNNLEVNFCGFSSKRRMVHIKSLVCAAIYFYLNRSQEVIHHQKYSSTIYLRLIFRRRLYQFPSYLSNCLFQELFNKSDILLDTVEKKRSEPYSGSEASRKILCHRKNSGNINARSKTAFFCRHNLLF